MIKRVRDIFLSLFGIIIVLPFFPIIALLIKLDSRGPVFYPGDRVGKDMKIFKMYKFRTMMETPIKVGESLSPQYDPRVTPFGRFLRRTKMNELPQFVNVLKGDMTFVGPRPETPDLAELYPEKTREIFSVKPGLVGPNQIMGRNEEELYPPGVDVKKYYIEKILPKKVKVDLEYVNSPTLLKDFKYILLGVKETLTGALSKRDIKENRSQLYLFVGDIVLSVVSFTMAYVVSFRLFSRGSDVMHPVILLAGVLLVRLFFFVLSGMYGTLTRYISYHEISAVLKGVTCGSLFFAAYGLLIGFYGYSKLFVIIEWLCLLFLLSGLRFGLRFYREQKNKGDKKGKKRRILIFGAGDAGYAACRAVTSDHDSPFDVVGFIDDAPEKYGKKLNGVKVLGNKHHMKALAQLYKAQEILLAFHEIDPCEMGRIIEICRKAGLKHRIFSVGKHGSGGRLGFPVRTLELADILPLKRTHMDHEAVQRILNNKTVLINGSGGALGLELSSRILQLGCRRLIIIDRYESYLSEMTFSLCNLFSKERIVPVLINPLGPDILGNVFDKYRPDVVFQAGLKKYIPFFMTDKNDIIRANYVGSFDLARLSIEFECSFFIMISSLAAAEGGNFVSNSLRISELSLQKLFHNSNCRLVISRICDIVENRGGVVSVMENHIMKREGVTLPAADDTICLISKYSAAEFILQTIVEATRKATKEGGVFVCNSGSYITYSEVARKLSRLYGLRLGDDLEVKYNNRANRNGTFHLKEVSRFEHTSHPNVIFFKEKGDIESHGIKDALNKFLVSENSKLSANDWKKLTQEVVDLYGLYMFWN